MEHKAYNYYKYAADRYNARAQLKVALLYEQEKGVDANDEHAFHYLKLSARGGNLLARKKAGEYITRRHRVERFFISELDEVGNASQTGDITAEFIWKKIRCKKTG